MDSPSANRNGHAVPGNTMVSRTVNEIHSLVRPFLEICILRKGPQDLPASGLLLGIAVCAHVLMSILLSVVTLNAWQAVLAGLTDTLLVLILTGTLLYAHRQKTRIVQTLTAMTGTGAIITLVAIPVFSWLYSLQSSGSGSPLAGLLVLALIAWSLGISGHILRHALSIPYFLGIFIAFVFFWISHSVFTSLFPLGN